MPTFANSNSWIIIATFVFVLLIWMKMGNDAGLKRVERKLDAIAKYLEIDFTAGVDQQVVELAHAGKKIEAIKLYREKTGVGLKAAKDFVDSL